MNLLQKFAGVTVTADARITEADRHFCQAHQAAYDNAKDSLQELLCFWEAAQNQQAELLAGTDTPPSFYIGSRGNISLSREDILNQISSRHSLFIGQLVSFFNKTYHLSLSITEIEHSLIPDKPDDRWTDDYEDRVKAYTETLQSLSVRYTDVLDQIFLYTDGRELSDQTLHELKEKCRRAAWNASNGQAKFTQKRCTLLLTGYACHYQDMYGGGRWELVLSTSDILRGIAHFETGDCSNIPLSIGNIIGSYNLSHNVYEFYDCQKALSLKLYKNNRVDIKFSTKEYAWQFVSEYLGDIC